MVNGRSGLDVLLGRQTNMPSDVYFESPQQFCWPSSLCPPRPRTILSHAFLNAPEDYQNWVFGSLIKTVVLLPLHFKLFGLAENHWDRMKSWLPGSAVRAPNHLPPQGGPWQTHGRDGQGLLTIVSQVRSNPSPAAYMSWCPSMPLLCLITSFSFISQRKDFYYQEKRLQQCLPPPGRPMDYTCWTPRFSLPLGSYYFDPHPFSRLFLLFSVLG